MCEPVTLGLVAGGLTGWGALGAGAVAATGTTAAVAGMSAMQALALGASVGSTVMSAGAAYQQGQATQKIAENNAIQAGYAAQDAQFRGEEEAAAIQRKAASLKSAQRVSMASKGLDLSYGTASDLQDQVDFFAQSDAATARTNAGREAWRYTSQGQDFRNQGAAAAYNGSMSAAGSLLAGASSVADKWSVYKTPRKVG